MRRWVPNPGVLSGRRICRDSQWGRVLASYVAQLSPQFVVRAPLPPAMLIDQLGALLALTASELSGRRAVSTPVERSVPEQIYDHIKQRCPDTSLQAGDVASFAQHIQANRASGAGGVWRDFRGDADPSSRRSCRPHAAIAAVRSRDHSGKRATCAFHTFMKMRLR